MTACLSARVVLCLRSPAIRRSATSCSASTSRPEPEVDPRHLLIACVVVHHLDAGRTTRLTQKAIAYDNDIEPEQGHC